MIKVNPFLLNTPASTDTTQVFQLTPQTLEVILGLIFFVEQNPNIIITDEQTDLFTILAQVREDLTPLTTVPSLIQDIHDQIAEMEHNINV